MTAWRNNAPTMTDSEIAIWERRMRQGRVAGIHPYERIHGPKGTGYFYRKGCRCEPCCDWNRERLAKEGAA